MLEFYEFGIKSTILGPKSQMWILEKPHIASLPFEDIVNKEGSLFNTRIFVMYKLYFRVSPITNPSCEAYFKAAYTNCQLKFACSRFNKN